MTRRSQRIAVTAMAGLAAAGLAACSSSPSNNTSSGSTPVHGGTLKIVAASGPDHIDTVPAYYTADYILERGYARQLLTYPTVPDPSLTSAGWSKDTTPVPDVATTVPTTSNGGISKDGKTYTFHLKSGVDWNTSPPRQVVAADFVREYKAFCNPVSPVGNPLYYQATIAGLKQYCSSEAAYFANKKHAPSAANIANFQNTHTISGVTAVSPSTLQFKLISPASDFQYMLAMPFTSARPVEYDKYVPNSLQLDQHTISDGPYQITSYVPSRSITMMKNPAWKKSTDPNRNQYVNQVQVTMGVSDAQTQFNDMKAGQYDLPLDTGIVPSEIPTLESTHDPKFRAWPGSNTLPYMVFNLRSPNNGGAMGKLAVRQAIEYGVNKVAVQKVVGGPTVAKILNTAIPPGNVGFQNYNDYPSNNSQGDPSKCKSMLASAGYKNGLTLSYLYPNDSINKSIFEALQASLRPCGVNLAGKPESGSTFFVDLGNAPANAKPGTWDMGQAGWFPDWFGNNGRTVISPLFETNCTLNTSNYGCYSSPKLDSLIAKAESATSTSQAGSLWGQADHNVMGNAVIVPLLSQQLLMYSSTNTQQAGTSAIVYHPNIGGPDITNVWLKNG
ncbi:MAG TPA: ABC transporter substrate-binding protein [Streptosporangiaceae bacterium]|nr:ABC transporter substrate-binding protein [Streptosporangiaceae bacterium]